MNRCTDQHGHHRCLCRERQGCEASIEPLRLGGTVIGYPTDHPHPSPQDERCDDEQHDQPGNVLHGHHEDPIVSRHVHVHCPLARLSRHHRPLVSTSSHPNVEVYVDGPFLRGLFAAIEERFSGFGLSSPGTTSVPANTPCDQWSWCPDLLIGTLIDTRVPGPLPHSWSLTRRSSVPRRPFLGRVDLRLRYVLSVRVKYRSGIRN